MSVGGRRLGGRRRPEGGAETLVASSLSLIVARLVVAALGWSGTVLVVRTLSTDEWGRFSFIFGFLGLVSVLTNLGVGQVVIAGLLAEEGDRRSTLGSYVVLRTILGTAGYGIAVAFVLVAGYSAQVVLGTLVAGLVLVFATAGNALDAAFQAQSRLRPVAVANALGQLAQLALTVALVVAGGGLVLLTIPAVLFEVVSLGYKLRRLPPELRPHLNVDRPAWRALLTEAVPIAIGGIFTTAFYRIDVVMLSRLDSFSATGLYGIAYKFADVVHFAALAVTTAVLPLLVRTWQRDPGAFHRTFSRALLLTSMVGAIAVVEFALFARPAIELLYGERFGPAATATKLVVGGEFAHFFISIAFTTLIATRRHRIYPAVALAGLALNVGLNLWLIPARSFEGAAIATLVTECLMAVVMMALVLRIAGTRPLPASGFARIGLAGALALAVGVVADRVGPWPVAGALALIAFLAAAHVLRVAGPGGLRGLVDEIEVGGDAPERDGAR